MRSKRGVTVLVVAALAAGAVGCATGEDVDGIQPAKCRGNCADVGASGDADDDADLRDDGGEPGDSTSAGDSTIDDSSVASDTAVDTGAPDTGPLDTGPTCDGGATWCGDASGCRDLSGDLSNCGACGKTCASAAHATPVCTTGACGFTCDTGWDDCDGSAGNGCETALQTDESNCGACGKTCLSSETCVAGACTPKTVVLEDFELSTWPKSPWKAGSGTGTGSASTACEHDGARGYAPATSGPVHYWRSDVTVGAPGTKVSAWYRTTGAGRFYLGFGATSAGTWSFVAAPNTNQLMFESNRPYGTYTAIATKSRSWATGTWFKLEVTFGSGGSVTGTVYASDGTTVVDTLSTTISGFSPGGVALRAFASGTCIDTYEM